MTVHLQEPGHICAQTTNSTCNIQFAIHGLCMHTGNVVEYRWYAYQLLHSQIKWCNIFFIGHRGVVASSGGVLTLTGTSQVSISVGFLAHEFKYEAENSEPIKYKKVLKQCLNNTYMHTSLQQEMISKFSYVTTADSSD